MIQQYKLCFILKITFQHYHHVVAKNARTMQSVLTTNASASKVTMGMDLTTVSVCGFVTI